jgi:hypothetical protein
MTQLDELDIKIAGSLSLGGVAAHDAGCVRPMPREFTVPAQQRGFVLTMAAGSVARSKCRRSPT